MYTDTYMMKMIFITIIAITITFGLSVLLYITLFDSIPYTYLLSMRLG